MRSESERISSSSSEIRSIALPFRALLEELAVDELYGADVHAAGRLGGDDDVGVARELAREDGLLLVAARERAGPRVRDRGGLTS